MHRLIEVKLFFGKSHCFVYLSNTFDFGREMSRCILQKPSTSSASSTFSVATSAFEATTVAVTTGKCPAAGNGTAFTAQAVTQGVLRRERKNEVRGGATFSHLRRGTFLNHFKTLYKRKRRKVLEMSNRYKLINYCQ